MSLLTDASLILTPNAYNVGKLYSVIPNTTLGDMDVSRGSSATRVNSAGLIEIARTNLLLQSQTFEDASWTKTNVTVTANATTAPNGTFTADKLTITTTLGVHQINRLSVVASSQCAMSIYAKADGVNTFTILDGTGSYGSVFNLSTETVTNLGTGVGTMVSVGDGWYRCITIVTTTGFRLYCPNSSSSAGDGTSGIYIWGAQLEAGETATEYIPTTTSIRTKFAGITQDGGFGSDIPRIDYPPLGGCPSILVEPARTNLVLYSEQFDNAYWFKSGVTVTPNTTTAPDGIMTTDNVNITATGGYLRRNLLTFANSTSYTISIFVKKSATTGTKNFRFYYNNNEPAPDSSSFSCLVDLTNITATITLGGTIPPTILSTKLVNYVNNWYRVEVAFTTSALGGSSDSEIGLQPPSGGPVVDFDAWGAQLELGSYASSYIPTVAGTVTRTADVISKTGITNLIGQTEGTIFVEANLTANTAERRIITVSNGTENQRIMFWTDGTILYVDFNNSSVTVGTFPIGTAKIALGYTIGASSTNYSIKVNNNTLITGTAASAPSSLSAIHLGCNVNGALNLNDRIKLATLFKTRLTDDQCILLTGPSFSSYPEMASALIYTLQ